MALDRDCRRMGISLELAWGAVLAGITPGRVGGSSLSCLVIVMETGRG